MLSRFHEGSHKHGAARSQRRPHSVQLLDTTARARLITGTADPRRRRWPLGTLDSLAVPGESGTDMSLSAAIALVETSIRSLGIDPAQARAPQEGPGARFALRRGSAEVFVVLAPPSQHDAEGTLRIVAPVIQLPPAERRLALFERLLRINAAEARGCAFALSEESVVIVHERSVRDLDASEVDAAIRMVGAVADHFDDALAREFGATLARG